MVETTDLFDKSISFINKTVLSVGNNYQVIKYLQSKRLERLFLYPNVKLDQKLDNIEFLNIKECDRVINKLDTILINLDCNNIKEFKTLKCIMEILAQQRLNSKLDLIVLKKSKSDVSEKTLYQDLIMRLWEGLICFKNINNSVMPNLKYINLNS